MPRDKTANAELPTKLYRLSAGFAQRQKLPVYFAGKALFETERAVYLYGKGTVETARMGVCYACGRTLTHPVSLQLGIGPICGGHYHDWDLVGGFTPENVVRLKQVVRERIAIDAWVPKACVLEELPSEEVVEVPPNHPMLKHKTKKKVAKTATLKDNLITILFPFDREDIRLVKTFPGRQYHDDGPDKKYWTAPLSREAVKGLQDGGWKLCKELIAFLTEKQVQKHKKVRKIKIPGLKMPLYPYQNIGVSFMESRNGRMLLGDDMGLGKTIQGLAWLHINPKLRPAVVVCPANAKYVWPQQGEKFFKDPPTFQILSGRAATEKLDAEVLVVNYDVLPSWVNKLKAYGPKVIITDECQYYKNSKAKRTKAVKELAKGVPHFIAMSGTPAKNRTLELYNAIHIIDPTLFPSFWEFAKRYCGLYHDGFAWNMSGNTNTEELYGILTDTIMLRRLKVDVLTELPPKVRSVIPMDLTNREEYEEVEDDFIAWIEKHKGEDAAERANRGQAFAKIEALKQLTIKGKMQQAISWIKEFLESGDKLVVFATHVETVKTLMKEFGKAAVKIDGSVSSNKRQQVVEQFQTNDDVRLFVGNIQAAGIAITLTAASSVAFVEIGWGPGEHDQAEDRIHRIGQEADSVNIYYLLARNSIEGRIVSLIDRKRGVLANLLDGQDAPAESMLADLLRGYKL